MPDQPSPETPTSPVVERRGNESFPAYVLLAVLIWLIMSPDSDSGMLPLGDVGSQRLEHEKYALQVLQNATWESFSPKANSSDVPHVASEADSPLLFLRDDGSHTQDPPENSTLTQEDEYIGVSNGFLNLTGFRRGDNYSWQGLDDFRSRCDHRHRDASLHIDSLDKTWDPRDVPVWHNMSGVVTGRWTQSLVAGTIQTAQDFNLTKLSPFVDWLKIDEDWGWNMSQSTHGAMKLTFHDLPSEAKGYLPPSEDDKDPDPKMTAQYRAQPLSASISMEDESGNYEMWDMSLYGLHWPVAGAALLTTTSDKFDGIFGLPLLAPSREMFLSGRHALNASLTHRLAVKENELFSDPRISWGADDYGNAFSPMPQCEYLVFLQLLPPDKNELLRGHPQKTVRDVFDDMERELRFPQGAPMPHVPPLQMSAVVYSPDCGFYLESVGPPAVPLSEARHLTGVRAPVSRSQLNNVLIGLLSVLTVQLCLIKRQMRESSTPSTLGRVSFVTISMMSIADGLLMMFIMVFLLTSHSSMTVVALVFVSLMTTVMGIVFMYKIFHTQLPDRLRERERARSAALAAQSAAPTVPVATAESASAIPDTPAAATTATAVDNDSISTSNVSSRAPSPSNEQGGETETDTLLPTTHRTPSPPVIVPSDQDIDAEIGEQTITNASRPTIPTNTVTTPISTTGFNTLNFTHVTRCIILFAVCLIILLLSTFAQRRSIRALIFNSLSMLYLSLWFPQIYRNISRNSRRALSWEFMIGQSAARLTPLAYLYAVDDNALLLPTDRRAFAMFAGWLWLQLWLLAAQDFLGARIGVPKSWFPDGWDYHPILREDGLESGPLPIGIAEAPRKLADSSSSSVTSLNSSSPLMPGPSSRGAGLDESGAGGSSGGPSIRIMDCAICREDLEVPVLSAGEKDAAGVVGVFARRAYMVTPCGHVFHTPCLEGWMRFRLQCPNCREDLPPL
ncbi:Transmembrane E3 ubiquitin-protein ligase 1 [Ceratocystis fimbriata CBS 114723]|uniref:DSC E3 ubiquitin ligase complex subunit A n=1 Tax=Ceratocystis fimbriata CBS 114723 TaxID=1035309 RepID=A0A2C5X007_9PEZI|nr:Transmembrane E3 ubiquitin-protein ligase 1 [Ceratocystis fimbriata CBS 114723]